MTRESIVLAPSETLIASTPGGATMELEIDTLGRKAARWVFYGCRSIEVIRLELSRRFDDGQKKSGAGRLVINRTLFQGAGLVFPHVAEMATIELAEIRPDRSVVLAVDCPPEIRLFVARRR